MNNMVQDRFRLLYFTVRLWY